MDILLLEPTRDDLRMFSYNIMRYSARKVVAAHAYRSTLQSFASAARANTGGFCAVTASGCAAPNGCRSSAEVSP